jgi:integrase
MATFEKRTTHDGTTTYRVKVRRKGYSSQTATFAKLADAKKWAQITEGAVLEGRYFHSTAAKRHTVGEMIDRYLVHVLPHKRANTVRPQQGHLRWWKACLGNVPLAELTPALIVEYRDKLASGGDTRRANSTVNHYLSTFSHALTVAAAEWGWLDESPMRNIKQLRWPRGRMRFLTQEERQRLLTACTESDARYLYPLVVLALSTGARQMELLTLTWSQVDFEQKVLHLLDTKNGTARVLPLTGRALELMRDHFKVRRADTMLVFPGKSGRTPVRLRTAWETAVRRADLTDFTFHDMRHTFASYLAMNGASLMEVAEALGHKTLAMVKRYAHLSEAHTRGVVERMNRAVFGE